jgi:hypothetical protein
MDPGNIDSVINKMLANPVGIDGHAPLVGVAELPPSYF